MSWFPPVMKRSDKLPREDFIDAIGTCLKCGRPTLVLKPCCYSGVSFEKDSYIIDDFEDIQSVGNNNKRGQHEKSDLHAEVRARTENFGYRG